MPKVAPSAKPLIILWLACLRLLIACSAQGELAEREGTGGWLSEKQVYAQLQRPLSLTWSKVRLRAGLKRLAEAQRVAILLDRRVDPSQKIELSLADVSLSDALSKIAQEAHAGYCQFGAVAYLGPARTADRLRTIAALRRDDIARLSSKARRDFLILRPWGWLELATPRDVLAGFGQEIGIELDGIEQVPHDLWPAADLPAMAWSDRLTLVLAEFDLTFQIAADGRNIKLAPMPEKVSLERVYLAGGQSGEIARRWAARFPQARVRTDGPKIVVDARLEEHEAIAATRQAAPAKSQSIVPGKEVYTLTVRDMPLGRLLDQLGERLHVEFDVDKLAIEKANLPADPPISLSVRNASLDELLRSALRPVGLSYERQADVITIVPAKRSD